MENKIPTNPNSEDQNCPRTDVRANQQSKNGLLLVIVSNPKIGRSRVILGYFRFFWGYFRLNTIFRNAKWSHIFSSESQYMVEAVRKAE